MRMRAWQRAALGGLFLVAWPLSLQAVAMESLDTLRWQRFPPPEPRDVLVKLALLPDAAQEADAARLVRAASERALEAESPEGDWARLVASVLSPAERAEGLKLAAGLAPAPLPPPEANRADPELLELARLLADAHGYGTARPPATLPPDDWQGADQRTRARTLRALVLAGKIDADRAHVLLHATLACLDAHLTRSSELEFVREELPGVMGEAKPTQ